jgi:hypothetical protein
MVFTVCYCWAMDTTDRPQKTITTPSGSVIVLKEYLTGREKRALTNIFIGKGLSVSESGVQGLDASVINAGQDLAFTTIIVSIDGNTENIVERVLDMRSSDYEAVVKAINEITGDADFAKKKTS